MCNWPLRLRRESMGNKKIVGTVAVVVILAALGSLSLTLLGLPPRVDARPHEALGEAMARETLKQLGPGGRIHLIRRDTALYPNPAAAAQVRAFHRTLRKSGTRVAVTNIIKIDPLRVVSAPSGDFFQLLKKASEADVIASFLGPPVFAADQLGKLEPKRPKVVAVCSGDLPRQVDLKRLFAEELLHAAVLSRRDPSAILPASDNLQAWFDHFFVLASQANLAELAPTPERK